MLQYSTPSLLAVATGIVGASWTSGAIAFFSLAGAPSANAVPQTSAKVWAELYKRGAAIMPKVAISVALSYLYAAYDAHSLGGNWQGFAGAAACVVSVVPFTLFAMMPTNDTLHKAAKDDDLMPKEQISGLLGTWGALNMTRSVLPLAGAVLGAMTFLSNVR